MWGRQDDQLDENGKLLSVSFAARWIHTAARSWSNRNLTDGIIPRKIAYRLGAENEDCRPNEWIQELCDARLFEVLPDGSYMIHDFLVYNMSREEVLAAREAQKAGRARGGAARAAGARRERGQFLPVGADDQEEDGASIPAGSPAGGDAGGDTSRDAGDAGPADQPADEPAAIPAGSPAAEPASDQVKTPTPTPTSYVLDPKAQKPKTRGSGGDRQPEAGHLERVRAAAGPPSTVSDDENPPEPEDLRRNIRRVYLHYLRTMGYCEAEYALTRRRRLAIRSRLGEYDPEVLEAAIETCRASPWHMGQGPNSSPGGYHELDKHILKSRECVEVWLRRRRSQHGAQTVAR